MVEVTGARATASPFSGVLRKSFLLTVLISAACAPAAGSLAEQACRITSAPVSLSSSIYETSGLALSRRDSASLWTHNDSGNEPVLFALDSLGASIRQVTVTGATLVDWEDIAAGPCDSISCLFIADTGDNAGRRDSITIYVVPEPDAQATTTESAIALHARYPDGPQDNEAIFVLPNRDIYLVTKGRQRPVALYRFPRTAQQLGATATLELIRALTSSKVRGKARVTGASATPDGRFVAIRSYGALYIYETASLIGGGPTTPAVFNLSPLNEQQGEGIAISDSGNVRISSEAEVRGSPEFSRLKCDLPEPVVAAQITPGAQASNP